MAEDKSLIPETEKEYKEHHSQSSLLRNTISWEEKLREVLLWKGPFDKNLGLWDLLSYMILFYFKCIKLIKGHVISFTEELKLWAPLRKHRN